MPRFERERDGRHQFWEVEIDGREVTFRFGDVGTPGRSRTQVHRNEAAAREAVSTGEAEMTNRGYRRALQVEASPVDQSPVFTQLVQGDDPEAWMIHADWLQERGDPLGQLVVRALQGEDVVPELPQLERLSGHVAIRGRNGYVDALEVVAGSAAVTEDPDAVVLATLNQPLCQLMRSLRLITPHASAVVPLLALPALESLSLAEHPFRSAIVRNQLDMDALAVRSPRLTSLALGHGIRLKGLAGLERLKVLELRGWPFVDRRQLDRLQLERVEVHHVDEGDRLRLLKSGVIQRAKTLVWGTHGLPELARFGGPAHIVFTLNIPDDDRWLERIPGLQRATFRGRVSPRVIDRLKELGIAVDGDYELWIDTGEPAAPTRPPGLEVQRLENIELTPPRFWEVGRVGNVLHIRYGQLGHDGRWVWRAYPDEEIAMEASEEAIKERIRQGYRVLETLASYP